MAAGWGGVREDVDDGIVRVQLAVLSVDAHAAPCS